MENLIFFGPGPLNDDTWDDVTHAPGSSLISTDHTSSPKIVNFIKNGYYLDELVTALMLLGEFLTTLMLLRGLVTKLMLLRELVTTLMLLRELVTTLMLLSEVK